VVTWILIAINVAVFVLMYLLGETDLEAFIRQWSIIPANIVGGQDYVTLITAIFMHGGIGHIVGNMMFLNIFGDNLEDYLGHMGYLVFYLLAGLGASILQIAVDPTSTVPNLGASGAIAGLMGGYLLLFPKHQVDVLVPWGLFMETIRLPAYTMLGYWFIVQFFSGVGSLGWEGGGVAYFAHIGGFVAGVVLVKILGLLRRRGNFKH
jgi:membrane associated rhomboid family serine protease